jgi:ribosomal protein S18 acetylase RimI-like enzyme
MTLYARDGYSSCELYRRDDVASIGQFGVDPAYQDRGIGKLMLAFAEQLGAHSRLRGIGARHAATGGASDRVLSRPGLSHRSIHPTSGKAL